MYLVEESNQENFGSYCENFKAEMGKLSKANGEAKDNVKFLSTLERQFKTINTKDLPVIEETLSSLMNGLKLVWVISRHIKEEMMNRILCSIANEIANKVAQCIDIKRVFTDKESDIDNSIEQLNIAIRCMQKWSKCYQQTKEEINTENQDKRWDFQHKDLFGRTEYMVDVCEDLKEACTRLGQFYRILGNELKEVMDDSERIDNLREQVRNLVQPLETVPFDPFLDSNKEVWTTNMQNFLAKVGDMEEKTISEIKRAFKEELKNAEGGFNLLQNISNIKTAEKIELELRNQEQIILEQYQRDLERMIKLFRENKDNPPISRNKPPVAGAIAWEKSIYARIKRPMMKFYKKDKMLQSDKGISLCDKYVKFIREDLEDYEEQKFQAWSDENKKIAIELLKNNILLKTNESKYVVNFSYKLKMLIKEAKYLDRIGQEPSKTIFNIALQENDYIKYVDKLKQMLNEYDDAVGSMSIVERKLLQEDIEKLNQNIDPGVNSYNWTSLAINEFIANCTKAINSFRDRKNQVMHDVTLVEEKIEKIESTIIVKPFDWSRQEPMDLMGFFNYFEKHRLQICDDLLKDYESIGKDLLINLEQKTSGTDTGMCPAMGDYYKYIERRIFNALVRMIVKAYATLRGLFNPPSRRKPLFKITAHYNASYNLSDCVYIHPNSDEMHKVTEKLIYAPLVLTKQFVRWKKGSCKFCQYKEQTAESGEEEIYFSFFRELDKHPLIANLIQETFSFTFHVNEKIGNNSKEWSQMYREQKLFDGVHKDKFDKNLEKTPTTKFIERELTNYENTKLSIVRMEKRCAERICYYLMIDNTDIIKSGLTKVQEFIDLLRKKLFDTGKKDLDSINKKMLDFEERLEQEPVNIETLKLLLKDIQLIKSSSMNMELSIAEVQDKFGTLKSHKYSIPKEDQDEVDGLVGEWEKLLKAAEEKDYSLQDSKRDFANVTSKDVENFKREIQQTYARYLEEGPGAEYVNLAKGYQALKDSLQAIAKFNEQREGFVLAEKLFNLPISSYPELNEMEQKNKLVIPIYDLYERFINGIKEYSHMKWVKLDTGALNKSAADWKQSQNRMAERFTREFPYDKLKNDILDFQNSLPFITKLKNPAIQDHHWVKILKETGKDDLEFDMKIATLEQVFKLELHNHGPVVDEVYEQASHEAKNEEELRKLDKNWKFQSFAMKIDQDIILLRSVDTIKDQLEDDIQNLQTISMDIYLGKKAGTNVSKWLKNLNLVSDVIDVWFIVQKKWIYLQSIFGVAGGDIRVTLKEAANKFDHTDKKFKKIMDDTAKNPNVLTSCITSGRLEDLRGILRDLEICQKKLARYLESKRLQCPRFYFLSDDELLFILGTTDVENTQKHIPNIFMANITELKLSKSKAVVGMRCEEEEDYDFRVQVKPDGPVEEWINKVADEMKRTMKLLSKEAVFYYAKDERTPWITGTLGQCCLVASQVWWTYAVEDVFRRVREGDKYAMKNESVKQTVQLDELIDMIRTDIDNKNRNKVNTLIVINVHGRDIVEGFVRDSILDAKEFEWESQLRFYWDHAMDDIQIKQCTGVFNYGHEYQGLSGRLVITPLTDRCVMTLTTALTFYLGGAPAGPAGTGKTETVKDLAKAVGLKYVVNNCGEGLDYRQMGKIFSGLSQTGFWGCFDEFNRVNPAVLSVVASQIKAIQNALAQAKDTVNLLETDMHLENTVGIFVTMNPGYAGRSELPENVKALFRPVVMVVPDMALICEIMLMSEGFLGARVLAKKMTRLYALASEQLSKQHHYDFKLRALKSVLVMAGRLKRAYQKELAEDVVLMRALRDMNMPKFVFEDVPLFAGLIQDLFPGLKCDRVGYDILKEQAILRLENLGMRHDDPESFDIQIDKVIQLFETMETRHTTMVVGPTGGGKSVIINTLKEARGAWQNTKVIIDVINSKSVTVNELYGVLDTVSRDWTDGLLSKIFRERNEDLLPGKSELHWILFDGDVDTVWVESMNSVMDDNRLLTLTNGERITLKKFSALLFEVGNLNYASPATVSRCGMVYVDPKNLGYRPYYEHWYKAKIPKFEELADSLQELYGRYVKQCIELIFEGVDRDEITSPLPMVCPKTPLNLVVQLCWLLDAIIPEKAPPSATDQLEPYFVMALVWSMGGSLLGSAREKFDEFVKRIYGRMLTTGLVYDSKYEVSTRKWLSWDYHKATFDKLPTKFSQILVPTVDTARYKWILEMLVEKQRKPVLFIGESGTAKSVTIESYLKGLTEDPVKMQKFTRLNINFSSRTTSKDLQSTLEENLEKRTMKQYGPVGGKSLIVFIDDMNMPKVDIYGTQQPIALLKFLIERGELYQRSGDLELHHIKDTQYLGAMTPPGGGNNQVDMRFLSLFSTFNLTFPSDDSIETIYNSMLTKHLENRFGSDVTDGISKVTASTLELHRQICARLPRTPIKFHYIFNLRDLSRVYEGLLLSVKSDNFCNLGHLVRLWRHECMRVYADRLVTPEDKELVSQDLIPSLVRENFSQFQDAVMADPIIYGDFMQWDPSDTDVEDPRIYEDLINFDNISKKFAKILDEYNYQKTAMNLVLFKDAMDHICRIHRIIRFPRGNALLVGVGGSGKQSLTKLATFTAGYDLSMIKLKKNYKDEDFRIDLIELYKDLLQKDMTFMFTDSHVMEEGFLEYLNNILTIGMVPALFVDEEKDLMIKKVKDEAFNAGATNDNTVWNYFVNKARDKLHVVLCMSPAGNTLMLRCRNFPGLVSSTSIDWFFPWPEEALDSVAVNFLKEETLPEENRTNILKHIIHVHLSIQEYSIEYETKYKRRNYSTPKSYLDFISNYRVLLTDNRTMIRNLIQRLEGGLKTLVKASEDTNILSKELEKKNALINEKKSSVELLIADINEKTSIAEEQNKKANVSKIELRDKSEIIAIEQKEAEDILERAMPAVKAAEEALNNINNSEIAIIKKLGSPPVIIKDVCTLVYYFMSERSGDGDDWATDIVPKLLSRTNLLGDLKEFKSKKDEIKEWQARKARHLVKKLIDAQKGDEQELEKKIKLSSTAALGLFQWGRSIMKYYDLAKDVRPKQEKVARLTVELSKLKASLAETVANIKVLTETLIDLNETKQLRESELAELTEQSNRMAKRLNAAERLIKGLSSEMVRWKTESQTMEEDIKRLVGDCLLGASFLSYAGPFNQELRKKMINEDWTKDIMEKEIPFTENIHLPNLLSSDVEIARWASEGLPGDDLSIQNGILTTRASRFPLCVDPQLQAIEWIKSKERRKDPFIITFATDNFMKKVTLALTNGKIVIFENVDEIDPMIDPILQKEIVVQAGQKLLKIGEDAIEWDDNFRMYLTSKIANPLYTPETMSKTMVINYNVTMQGLKDQLLNEVVGHEKPELEAKRKALINEMSENRTKLKEQEDLLLHELSANQDMPLVDNMPLIETLELAKLTAGEITIALETAKHTAVSIASSSEIYKPAAKLGAILYFAMFGLSAISSMYEYSLMSYRDVFKKALDTAKRDNIPNKRIAYIKDKLNVLSYKYTCLGIFEIHKLMFSFQMTTMLMDGDGELSHLELDFFLRGNTALEAIEERKPFSWITDPGWKDLHKLITLGDEWVGLKDSIVSNGEEWQAWYDETTPESVPMPCGYGDNLNLLQKLCVVRVLRTDRVINAIKQFIIAQNGANGEQYVTPPTLNYKEIFEQSSERTPIVFILSPGANPLAQVASLAENKGITSKFKFCSLGQGMEKEALNKLETGVLKGHWVMLQNCHLLSVWLSELEKFINDRMVKTNPDFRLWLTTEPIKDFPLGILQKALKVVTEPPEGLRQNMLSSYEKLSDERLEECSSESFKPLIFVLAFFHAILQDRRKFGKIGWNVKYAFNESDFSISFELLKLYLGKAQENQDENLPWNSLRYLIGEAMYGGRVTDDFDRRVLTTYLNEYMGEFLFDTNQPFFFSRAKFDYNVPKVDSYDDFRKFILSLPHYDTPEVFGLHPNAEIGYFNFSAKEMWTNLLEMQISDSGSGGGINREKVIEATAQSIQAKLPELFDYININKQFESAKTPTQTVLLQEIERFNNLISRMAQSLKDLKRALKGEIGMSGELDRLAFSLFNGFLPDIWKALAPQTLKSLASWMEHFERRFRQYEDWVENQEPAVIWLSGFHIPESYLTALVQIACRSKGWALDKSTLYTVVTKHKHSTAVKDRLPFGSYISGLYLEGARWSISENSLARQE